MLGLSLVAASGGHSSSRCAGLSLSQPLLLRSTGSRCAGSVIVAHGLSCSAACGIFPDQGSNPCPLHWQADSQPLRHQGSPDFLSFYLMSFYSRTSSETLHSRLLTSFLTVSDFPGFWCPWQFWGGLGWYCVDCCSTWIRRMFLPHDELGLHKFLERKTTEVACPAHHSTSGHTRQRDSSLLAEACLSGISTVQSLPPPAPVLLRRKSVCSQHWRVGIMCYLFEGSQQK